MEQEFTRASDNVSSRRFDRFVQECVIVGSKLSREDLSDRHDEINQKGLGQTGGSFLTGIAFTKRNSTKLLVSQQPQQWKDGHSLVG